MIENLKTFHVGRHRTQKTIEKMRLSHKGKRLSEETRQKIRLANLGEKSTSWKKDDVGMKALHQWINKNKPKPESNLCEFCNIAPLYDVANVTGIYNRDFENWKYLVDHAM